MVSSFTSVLPYVRLTVHHDITTLTISLVIRISSSLIASGTPVHLGHHQTVQDSILDFNENLSIHSIIKPEEGSQPSTFS